MFNRVDKAFQLIEFWHIISRIKRSTELAIINRNNIRGVGYAASAGLGAIVLTMECLKFFSYQIATNDKKRLTIYALAGLAKLVHLPLQFWEVNQPGMGFKDFLIESVVYIVSMLEAFEENNILNAKQLMKRSFGKESEMTLNELKETQCMLLVSRLSKGIFVLFKGSNPHQPMPGPP